MTYYQELIQHIEKVKEILTEETWNRHTTSFSINNKKLCMNVNGAIQIQINSRIKDLYNQYLNNEISIGVAFTRMVHQFRSLRSPIHFDADFKFKNFQDKFNLWIDRSPLIKYNSIINNIDKGNLDLHYLIRLVNLDDKFEKSYLTTLSMVKDKLDETIKLIKKIEKYAVFI